MKFRDIVAQNSSMQRPYCCSGEMNPFQCQSVTNSFTETEIRYIFEFMITQYCVKMGKLDLVIEVTNNHNKSRSQICQNYIKYFIFMRLFFFVRYNFTCMNAKPRFPRASHQAHIAPTEHRVKITLGTSKNPHATRYISRKIPNRSCRFYTDPQLLETKRNTSIQPRLISTQNRGEPADSPNQFNTLVPLGPQSFPGGSKAPTRPEQPHALASPKGQ